MPSLRGPPVAISGMPCGSAWQTEFRISAGTPHPAWGCESRIVDSCGRSPKMTPSEQFLKFAAECESMARLTRDQRDKPEWQRLAQRWVNCAEMAERQSLAVDHVREKREQNRRRP